MPAPNYGGFEKGFNSKSVPDYINFISETYPNFWDYVDLVDKLERPSSEFISLTSYHLQAIKNKTYYESYREAVKKTTGDDIGEFEEEQPSN